MTFDQLPVISQDALLASCYIAFGWMLANGFILIIGYYMRDRSHDE